MKRRVFKKWINRFITPLIEDMPKTEMRTIELVNEHDENMFYISEGKSLKVINGWMTPEGAVSHKSRGLFNDIKDSAATLEVFLGLEEYSNPWLREIETHKKYGFYIRLICFNDWPEGYAHKPYNSANQ